MDPVLVTAIDGAVARLTLNRPGQRNALSSELLHALRNELRRLAQRREIRAIVLAGEGPAFSSGHDLRELESLSPADANAVFALCSSVMQAIRGASQPVIARVHGIATAAGCQLVAACDLAIAADTATFATPGVNIGLFCSTPAVPVVRAIGRKRAMEMLLTGAPISAQTALEWGLVNRVVSGRDLDAAVDDFAKQIVSASGRTVAIGKQAFYQQVEMAESEAYAYATGVMCENVATEDAKEGIGAFLNRRRPVWRQE